MKRGFCFLSGQGGAGNIPSTQSSPAEPNYRAKEESKSMVPKFDTSIKVRPKGNKYQTLDGKATVNIVTSKDAQAEAKKSELFDLVASGDARVVASDEANYMDNNWEDLVAYGQGEEVGTPSEDYVYIVVGKGNRGHVYKVYLTPTEKQLIDISTASTLYIRKDLNFYC